MRLICPNCDAQYEVPDDVMPPEGRDVQCSNCSQTWFQVHPDADQEFQDALAPPVSVDEHDSARPAKTAEAPAAPEPEPDTDDMPEPETPGPSPKRKSLDPTVADVLREEAALEKQARQNETAGSVESQPELGLEEAEGSEDARKRARESRERVTPARPEPSAPPVAEATIVSGSRRDLLPNIEEINSTLRSDSDRSPGEDAGQTAQIEGQEKRSFGRGFILVVVLAALLVLIYVFAPQLAEVLPQADPWLSAYVSLVDEWRMWLDARVEALLGWLDATAASSGQ